MTCETIDFLYPLYADIYYPIVVQGSYNEVKKNWFFDRSIVCNAASLGGVSEVDVRPEMFLQFENKLIARSKSDLRKTSNGDLEALTNILVTNIRSASGQPIYLETSGPRKGRATIYEVVTVEPYVGPFGNIEYYKMLWRRTENQAVGD